MPSPPYRTTPPSTSRLPGGIPYIIGNEVAERFSFYGMKAILTIYMTKHLVDAAGRPDVMSDERAKWIYHLFTAAAYFFPIVGALVSDVLLGKYRTIIVLSIGYCLGHGFLALGDTGAGAALLEPRHWLYLGLLFIAIGAGGIKPCVSAHVGDQFGPRNRHLLSPVFAWFYFAINVGAATSSLLTPVLLESRGPWLAFGTPGVLMVIATIVFWLGRHRFVHVPPGGVERFASETLSDDGRRAVRNLAPIFLIFVPMFWAIFDQTGSAWVLQAEDMDRRFLGHEWLSSQIQAANPFLILVLIPIFTYGIYPLVGRVVRVTPLRRIGVGLFLTAGAAALSAVIQVRIDEGGTPNISWQLVNYVVLTSAEVLVSITTLEFAYTQAPRRMKSFIMGIYFLGVSLGNVFTAIVNRAIEVPELVVDGVVVREASARLEGADYYWFFCIVMTGFAIAFVVFARLYRGRTYVQGDEDPVDAARADAEAPH